MNLAPDRRWARRLLAALLCCTLALSPFGGSWAADSLPSLGDPNSDDLSPLAERKIGEDIMRQAREAEEIFYDPESTEYLNEFALNLVTHAPPSPEAFEFFLVLDQNINAFALPGGFIGINTGLIVSTASESELASVMSHEMGHVIQRHIARGIERQSQMTPLALAAMILGMLAMAKSTRPDGGEAAMTMGQNFLLQDQLRFSRDAEREADHVGFQILQDSGFDVAAMGTFFERLQQATGIYESGVPEWLRDHPMTTERIADIQNRTKVSRYRQRPDSLDFHLVRARMRVLQNTTVQGLRDSQVAFEDQLARGTYANEVAVRYGLALVKLRQKDYPGAQVEWTRVVKLAAKPDFIITNLQIELRLATKDVAGAVSVASVARTQFPQSRTIAWQYAKVLQEANRNDEAIAYLQDQLTQYHSESLLYQLLAKSYQAKGQLMLEHKALAEEYYLRGSVSAAIEQLNLARGADSGDFYEASQIDARLRELKAEWVEIQKQKKENHHGSG